jgi:hypothetical protein
MPVSFSHALLAALNEAVEVKESDWNSIAAVLRGSVEPGASRPLVPANPREVTENRFAETISSGMAKAAREGR